MGMRDANGMEPKNQQIQSRQKMGFYQSLTGGSFASEKNIKLPAMPKTTVGYLRPSKSGYFVYVGLSSSGLVKIGMSGNPDRRCKKDFGISLYGTVETTRNAAKMVETYALRHLGAKVGDDEWVYCPPEQALLAVQRAYADVCRFMHTNPALTAEEARLQRVKAECP